MIRQDRAHIFAYVLVSFLSVSGAFLISLHFIKRAKAQDPGPPPVTQAQAQAQAQAQPKTAAVPARPANPAATPAGAPPPTSAAPGAATAPTTADSGTAPPSAAPAPLPGAVPTAGITELEGFLEPFIYDIVNRRDPFQPYAEFVPSSGAAPDDNGPPRALSPAQRWDLDQLKLIGIMWDIKDPKAMFLDPEEDVMILGRDESIGNRNGYVATIREGEVVVVEAIRKRGDIIYRTKVIRIER